MDGAYYVLETNIDGKISAKCQECGEIRKGSISSTGNFKNHYKKHPSRFKALEEYLKQEDTIVNDNDNARQLKIADILLPVSQEKVMI